MEITRATPADLLQTVDRLTLAFAHDPITGFLLQDGPAYRERLARFFSLLMRARIALGMPVLVARDGAEIHGMVMGNVPSPPAWPDDIAHEWEDFERAVPGMVDRLAIYEGLAAKFAPAVPHYYLGVIGVDPAKHGHGIGMRLIKTFCDLSAADGLSHGVYLETGEPSNVRFYERAGFVEAGRGTMGSATLWCMYLPHARDDE
ncbi:Acetyltransferase (GNAT) family protein [Pseudoxanthomonas sp. CF385]|uniref:GNAT family N-acetyltransferase n=1 Tax=Pseudoxanthomonas sp. CF385 TaxID=1881042 RepID=UPI00087FE114|nr:GNAT family N-acetyltransferase [Pseudoxanthomonas sp. CF385]SDQ41425.1 Acetyltransferase (GNAT) family protein [Pseudoxanthomonas sp. CF385]